MGFLSLFLILLILVQRGKGGGLSGALGGPGGQSAFGSKAGDTFTVITVVVASIWGFTCAFTMWLLGTHAPTTAITDSAMSAGPSEDDAAADSGLIVPPMDGGEAGSISDGIGLSGIGDAESSEGSEAAVEEGAMESSDAEEVELTPADSESADTEEANTNAPETEAKP